MRALKFTVLGMSVLAALIWAHVFYQHVRVVLELRRFGGVDHPTVPPLLLLPLVGLAVGVFLVLRQRIGPALIVMIVTLGITILFWMSQSVSQLG